MSSYREEKDSLGIVKVPVDAMYGAQTQRAIDNFPISAKPMPVRFIKSLLLLKLTAAKANAELGLIENQIAVAIQDACKAIENDDKIMRHFPVDVFQTGSGTSTNMNANEVIAHIANANLKKNSSEQGEQENQIHPNDHVNFGQSSNDVIPSCIHISACLQIHSSLLPAINKLITCINTKAKSVDDVCKTGRTHLMDAMPIRLSQSMSAWSSQLQVQKDAIESLMPKLEQLAIGGTAVGTGVNTHKNFAAKVCQILAQRSSVPFKTAENHFALIASQDVVVTLSGMCKALAVTLMKIANDLRWMNSGPLAGIAEISLPALQPGSSIMPGKVNPVIPEAVAMAAAQVIGNDTAITIGGQSGNFELNVMLPMIASNLIESLDLLTNSMNTLADKAIQDFSVNKENIETSLSKNPVLVTALNPIIGYEKAAEIAKAAYKDKRAVIDVAIEKTSLSREELEHYLNPAALTEGGLSK
uniref:class II fumarate hydratase n=1 Tax=Ningiella ruwaisensis TaxID=2364274 RepID=UPI00109F2D11|nr:class II fumarate hydratase [Ningiella ruwaisensis]